MNNVLMNYYQSNDVTPESVLEQLDGHDVFGKLTDFFHEIRVVPEDTREENLTWRRFYLSEKTEDLLISTIKVYGSKYPSTVISLLARQEYTVHYRICEKYNLFEFLVNYQEIFVAANEKSLWHLFSYAYSECLPHIYASDMRVSVGSMGLQLRGFYNSLYSNFTPTKHSVGLHFYNRIALHLYDLQKLSVKFNISYDILKYLESSKEDEKSYQAALHLFCHKINQVIQDKYPELEVKIGTFFESRTDVDTDYYLDVVKNVTFESNYSNTSQNLKSTLCMMKDMELEYFGTDVMSEFKLNLLKEYPRIFPIER